MSIGATLQLGYYNFSWSGGTFEVQLRANGIFYCAKHPCDAKWGYNVESQTLDIDWGKFGQYVLVVKGDELVGSVRGSQDEKDWRKASLKRAFTQQEELLSASAWMLHHEGGTPFRVEFRADGHFNCDAYPGHHFYKLDGDKVAVDWGKFGSYDFTLDAAAKVMTGSLRGDPASWRKCEYVGPIAAHIANECSGHHHGGCSGHH